jgi:hypothetical protein
MDLHPRIVAREGEGPPTVAAARQEVHGQGRLGRFNAALGLKVTLLVGSMWCAYLFTLIALVSAPTVFKSHDSLIIVAWVAQTFLQLVLLPIIIVGQNVQAKAADARSLATFDDATAILHTVVHLSEQLDLMTKVLAAQDNLLVLLATTREDDRVPDAIIPDPIPVPPDA